MFFTNQLIESIKNAWNRELLGELTNVKIDTLSTGHGETGCYDSHTIDILLSNIAAALSTGKLLGTARDSTLKSTKNRLDTSAAHVFAHTMTRASSRNYIAISEGKDEHGEEVDDPLKRLVQQNTNRFGIAVDVIDGTTLAAKGLNGAYTLSASANGLISFPDLQAYAVGAPLHVLKKFEFNLNPEDSVHNFIQNLCSHYHKNSSELNIVTHRLSSEKRHHMTLIKLMESMGVNVIKPDPVTVEFPYVLSMAFRNDMEIDALIGVFGLPEIVINTVLLGIINGNYELMFRIASNKMLENPEQTSLNEAFSFSPAERKILKEFDLDHNKIYSKDSLAKNYTGASFSATALTKDIVMGLDGYKENGNSSMLQTIFSTFDGYILKITTTHLRYNTINYAACFSQPIDDLSIVLPVDNPAVVRCLQTLFRDIGHSGLTDAFQFSAVEELHVTLFELGIHYGGVPANSLSVAIAAAKKFLASFIRPVRCVTMGMEVTTDSIIIHVNIDKVITKHISDLAAELPQNAFFNVNSVPQVFHITLCRFKKYLSETESRIIKGLVENISKSCGMTELITVPELVHIKTTPYKVAQTWGHKNKK